MVIYMQRSKQSSPASSREQRKILIITNDFPPKRGGIEKFVAEVTQHLPAHEIVVLTSSSPGDREYDATLNFPVYRYPVKYLLPTPAVLRTAKTLINQYDCTSVWFGAAAPLGLLARPLHRAGITHTVATTHGHEIWWAKLPITRQILRVIGTHCSTVTYLGDFTKRGLCSAFGKKAHLQQLVPGVDSSLYKPDSLAHQIVCQRHNLPQDSAIVLSISRLIERKGQDQLIKIWDRVIARYPQAILLIGGQGAYQPHLRALAAQSQARSQIIFADRIPEELLPQYYAGAHIFAMPCRSRKLGLEVEGLGIVFLEAQASGLPVLVGDSGGAPDALIPQKTGYLVDGTDTEDIYRHIMTLLEEQPHSTQGAAGRAWVVDQWSWTRTADNLLDYLGYQS